MHWSVILFHKHSFRSVILVIWLFIRLGRCGSLSGAKPRGMEGFDMLSYKLGGF